MSSTAGSAGSNAGPAKAPTWVSAFAPAWFAAVMGTGVLAVTLRFYARYAPPLDPLAWVLHGLNVVLALLLAGPWLARWLRYPAAAMSSLRHPVQAHFYPTFSIALLVLSLQFLVFGPQRELALALWLLGAALTVVFSLAILLIIFQGESVTQDHVTPAMFIPPVGLVVIPVAGAPLAEGLPPGWREALLVANWAALGAGSLLYVGLLALTMFRYVLGKRVGPPLVPTAWINLGPLGVIPVSLLSLDAAMPGLGAGGAVAVIGLLLWGFGVWWLLMASLLTLAARSSPRAGGSATSFRWRRSSSWARSRWRCCSACGCSLSCARCAAPRAVRCCGRNEGERRLKLGPMAMATVAGAAARTTTRA